MKKITMLIVIGLFFSLCMGSFIPVGTAADADLAAQYAPILYFEGSEKCFPVNVSYFVENSYVYQVDTAEPVSMSPSLDTLGTYTSNDYYLDNQLGTVHDSGIIDSYQNTMSTLGYTVYAHVDSVNNVIQYWFFYAFNAGELNQHEGDWEMVQILLSGGQPSEVMYSQHYAGQKALWSQVDKEGDHIKVYVSRGSHANYFRPYSGKIGLASDIVGDNGNVLHPDENDYEIIPLESQGWLSFAGRWGWYGGGEAESVEASILGQAGPEGPMFRENGAMWNTPLVWSTSLFPVNDILFVLEWLLYNFVMLFAVVTILILLVLIYRIYQRSKKYGLGPRYSSLLYIDGGNLKSIGNILCIVGILVAVVGLFLPWYGVSTNISIPDYKSTGVTDLLLIDGLSGVQITLPDSQGPIPLGNFALPFSLFIGISLVFLAIATIGIAQSSQLGRKYIGRGIRLLIPFLLVFVIVMILGSLIPLVSPVDVGGNFQVKDAVDALAANPVGGEKTIVLADVSGGSVYLRWGFGMGLYLLVFAGIILIIAGGLEVAAKTTFFKQKTPEQQKEKKPKQPRKEPSKESSESPEETPPESS